jgi:hypothetical protein
VLGRSFVEASRSLAQTRNKDGDAIRTKRAPVTSVNGHLLDRYGDLICRAANYGDCYSGGPLRRGRDNYSEARANLNGVKLGQKEVWLACDDS